MLRQNVQMSRFTVSFLPDHGISTYSLPESSNGIYIYTRLFSIPLHVRCNVQKSARVSHNPNVYEIRATSFFFFFYPSRVFFSLYECACREIIFKENVLFDDCFFFYLCDVKLVLVNKINYIIV